MRVDSDLSTTLPDEPENVVDASRPQASLKAGSKRQPVEVVTVGIAAANLQHAGAEDIRNRVRDVRGIAMVGNKSGRAYQQLHAGDQASASNITPLSDESQPA